MAEKSTATETPDVKKDSAAPPAPHLRVAPGPHLNDPSLSTRRMMIDVLLGLAPVVVMAAVVFQGYAVLQIAVCVASCLLFEWLFTLMRGRKSPLGDFSAAVTGVILALSLPWQAPVWISVVASFTAIGLGKVVFGGLGYNIFNPAMVGRAFVMLSFPALVGAGGYMLAEGAAAPLLFGGADALTQATPLSAAKAAAGAADVPGLMPLFVGIHNGSLGETSILAILLGGIYLCVRRVASWEIPAGVIVGTLVLALLGRVLGDGVQWDVGLQLMSGSMLFGAFFIATDPVTSPLTPKGKWIFGLSIGALIYLIRAFSGYPEGTMFAVLLMNSMVPLLNRWTIPRPVGGPVPVRQEV
jgi:electron transport complex protein RnfD